MKFTLTSISGTALELETFERVILSTKDGTITILPGHEPLITGLHPWILSVIHSGGKSEFALGGWVVQISPESVLILADMIEDGGHDLNEIQARKEETAKKMEELRGNNDPISMEALIELEQEYLKDIAREQFTNTR